MYISFFYFLFKGESISTSSKPAKYTVIKSIYMDIQQKKKKKKNSIYTDYTYTSPNSVVIFRSWYPSCIASMQTFVRILTLASSKQSNGMRLGCYIGVDNGICLAQAFRTLYTHDCWLTNKLVLAH